MTGHVPDDHHNRVIDQETVEPVPTKMGPTRRRVCGGYLESGELWQFVRNERSLDCHCLRSLIGPLAVTFPLARDVSESDDDGTLKLRSLHMEPSRGVNAVDLSAVVEVVVLVGLAGFKDRPKNVQSPISTASG